MSDLQTESTASSVPKKQKTSYAFDLNTNFNVAQTMQWPLHQAIRELLANSADEDENATFTADHERQIVEISNGHGSGQGITRDSLTYKSNDKSKNPTVSGNFGYGLKDAIAILYSHGIKWKAISKLGTFEVVFGQNCSKRIEVQFNDATCNSSRTVQELSVVAEEDFSLDLQSSKNWQPETERYAELQSALSAAQSECVQFNAALKDATQIVSKNVNTLVATAFLFGEQTYLNSQLLSSFYVHNVLYQHQPANDRKFLFVYNLHMKKSSLRSRDRDQAPQGWHVCIENFFTYVNGEDRKRVMLILKNARERGDSGSIYELGSSRIMSELNRYLDQCEQLEKVYKEAELELEELEVAFDAAESSVIELRAQQVAAETDDAKVPPHPIVIAKATSKRDEIEGQISRLREFMQGIPGTREVNKFTSKSKVWIAWGDPLYQTANKDRNVCVYGTKTTKCPLVSQNPSYIEHILLRKIKVPESNYPIVRSVHRVLSALGIADIVGLDILPINEDESDQLVSWKCNTILVAFSKIDPTSEAALRALEHDLLMTISQAPFAALVNKTPVEAATTIAQALLQLVPQQLVFCNYQSSQLGSMIPVAFRPLLVVTEWSTEKGGISSYNLQLAHGLAAIGIEVFVVVIGQVDERVTKAWPKGEPCGSAGGSIRIFDCSQHRHVWIPVMNGYEHKVSHIVGHAHVTGKEAAQIASLDQFKHAKLWQFNHIIPIDVDLLKSGVLYDQVEKARKKDEMIQMLNRDAGQVWSVGQMMFENFKSSKINFKHRQIILPLNPNFHLPAVSVEPNLPPPQSFGYTFRVLFVGRCEDQYVKGLDIACQACTRATKLLVDGGLRIQVKLTVRGIPSSEVIQIIKDAERSAKHTFLPFASPEVVKQDLLDHELFIMPSRSEPFGLVATEAIASERPVLVSSNSGVARLLEQVEDDMGDMDGMVEIVETCGWSPQHALQSNLEDDIQSWGEAIARMVRQYPKRVKRAAKLRVAVEKYVNAQHPYEVFVNQGCKDLNLELKFPDVKLPPYVKS